MASNASSSSLISFESFWKKVESSNSLPLTDILPDFDKLDRNGQMTIQMFHFIDSECYKGLELSRKEKFFIKLCKYVIERTISMLTVQFHIVDLWEIS